MKNRILCPIIIALTLIFAAGCGGNSSSSDRVVPSTSSSASTESDSKEKEAADPSTAISDPKEPSTASGDSNVSDSTEKRSDSLYEQIMNREDLIIPYPCSADTPYDSGAYPDIAAMGTHSEDEIRSIVAAIDSMTESDLMGESAIEPYYFYCDRITQTVYTEEDNSLTIVEAYTFDEDPLLDKAMHAVGYKSYAITYAYAHGSLRSPMFYGPVSASLEIDGKTYFYYFADGQLIQRRGPEGISYNTKTNDFINTIWKVGCYYGNVLLGEADRYSLFVTSPDSVEDHTEYVVIHADRQGINRTNDFIIDKDTVFADTCETFAFENYKEADTPLSWYRDRIRDNAEGEGTGTALVGILDVQISGGHIDRIYGNYWWD